MTVVSPFDLVGYDADLDTLPAAWCRYPQVWVDGAVRPPELVRLRTLRMHVEMGEGVELAFRGRIDSLGGVFAVFAGRRNRPVLNKSVGTEIGLCRRIFLRLESCHAYLCNSPFPSSLAARPRRPGF